MTKSNSNSYSSWKINCNENKRHMSLYKGDAESCIELQVSTDLKFLCSQASHESLLKLLSPKLSVLDWLPVELTMDLNLKILQTCTPTNQPNLKLVVSPYNPPFNLLPSSMEIATRMKQTKLGLFSLHQETQKNSLFFTVFQLTWILNGITTLQQTTCCSDS